MDRKIELKILSNKDAAKTTENQGGMPRLDKILDAYDIKILGKVQNGRRKGLHIIEGGKK